MAIISLGSFLVMRALFLSEGDQAPHSLFPGSQNPSPTCPVVIEVGNYQTLQSASQITGQRISKKMKSEKGHSISARGPQLPGMSVCSPGYSEAGGFKGEHQPEDKF
ncbi:hypothetical protein CapIbe_003646 [Capra ibex]